jgi:hypothetical protein
MARPRPLSARDRVLLWLGFAGPPLAQAVHLLSGWGYEEAACATGTGVDLVEPVIVGLTVLLGGVTLVAGWGAVRLYVATSRDELADPRGRVRFMSAFGALSSVLFLTIIVLGGVQVVTLEPCAPS